MKTFTVHNFREVRPGIKIDNWRLTLGVGSTEIIVPAYINNLPPDGVIERASLLDQAIIIDECDDSDCVMIAVKGDPGYTPGAIYHMKHQPHKQLNIVASGYCPWERPRPNMGGWHEYLLLLYPGAVAEFGNVNPVCTLIYNLDSEYPILNMS